MKLTVENPLEVDGYSEIESLFYLIVELGIHLMGVETEQAEIRSKLIGAASTASRMVCVDLSWV